MHLTLSSSATVTHTLPPSQALVGEEDLPRGFEMRNTCRHIYIIIYYVNHNTRTTHWTLLSSHSSTIVPHNTAPTQATEGILMPKNDGFT